MTLLARVSLKGVVRVLAWVVDERSPIVDDRERREIRAALSHLFQALGPAGRWTAGVGLTLLALAGCASYHPSLLCTDIGSGVLACVDAQRVRDAPDPPPTPPVTY